MTTEVIRQLELDDMESDMENFSYHVFQDDSE